MSGYQVLIRGLATARDLGEVCDELGIAAGEKFLLATGDFLDPADAGMGPFGRTSDTSRQAALENYPRAGSQRERVLTSVLRAGQHGRTRDELEQATGLLMQAVTPRVWELVKGGWLIETDRTRTTRHGEAAAVLVATLKASAWQEAA